MGPLLKLPRQTQLFLTLILAVVVAWPVSAQEAVANREQLEILALLHRNWPEMFALPATCDVRPTEIFASVQRAGIPLAQLKQDRVTKEQRNSHIDIAVALASSESTVNGVINAAGLKSWRERLLGVFESLKNDSRQKPGDLVLSALARELLDVQSDAFKANVKTGGSHERLLSLLEIHLLLQGSDGRINASDEGLRRRIAAADEQALAEILRPSTLSRRGVILGTKLKRLEPGSERNINAFVERVRQRWQKLATDTVFLRGEAKVGLTIEEVPSVAGVFRMYAGLQCPSAQEVREAPLAVSRFERVFFIFDRAHSLRGSIAASQMRTGSGDALFVHSIRGAGLGVTEVQAILLAMYAQRAALGVAHIVLPARSSLQESVPGLAARAAIEKLAAIETVSLTPVVTEFRQGISTENKSGRLLRPNQFALRNLRTVVRQRHPMVLPHVMERSDLLQLRLSLQVSARVTDGLGTSLDNEVGADIGDVARAAQTLKNEMRLPLASYYQGVSDALGRLGLVVDEKFTLSHWPWFIRGHFRAPDVFSAQTFKERGTSWLETVLASRHPGLISAALEQTLPALLANSRWSEKLTTSPDAIALSMGNLRYVQNTGNDQSRAQLIASIQRMAPGLHTEYKSLATAATAAEFLQRLSGSPVGESLTGGAIESTLPRFFALRPNPTQIRQFVLSTQDVDSSLRIRAQALDRARTAAEFLAATDFVASSDVETIRAQLRKIVLPRLSSFIRFAPTVDEANILRQRLASSEADFKLMEIQLRAVTSAADAIKVVGLHPFDYRLHGKDDYWGKIRALLISWLASFTRLEPTVGEISVYRRQVFDTETDMKLLEIVAPKMTSARDFIGMISLFGPASFIDPRAGYALALREFLADPSHIDVFLLLRPTTGEINEYRLRMFSADKDVMMMRAAIVAAKSSREIIDSAIAIATAPERPPSKYDQQIMNLLLDQIPTFLARSPTTSEIILYRQRMGHPQGDLKLLDYGLGRASSLQDFQSLVGQRPRVQAPAFEVAWAAVLKTHFDRFLSLNPSPTEIASYIAQNPDPNARDAMESVQRAHARK